jgi:hypothetical protein
MRQLLRYLVLIVILYGWWGQASAAVQPPFWMVSSERGTVYMLGTLHVGKPDFYPLPAPVENAFQEAAALAVEVNLMGPEFAKALAWLMLNSALPPGKTLDTTLTPQTLGLLERKLRDLKLSLEAVNLVKPWIVAMNLTNLYIVRNGYQPTLGVDYHLLRKAKAAHKPIISLESARQQFEVFENLSWQEQEAFLRATLKEMDGNGDDFANMVDAWAAGDLKRLKALVLDPMANDPEQEGLFQRLFVERNKRMAEAIARMSLRPGVHFVAVGSGHFLGKYGIVALLRDKGIDVRRVRP